MNLYFEKAIKILKIFKQHGYCAYIVGGFVRDYIIYNKDLEKVSNDIDITTNCKPNDIIKIFQDCILNGIKYGTVGVKYEGFIYEITTFRKEEEYIDNRHPSSVLFTKNIEDDLIRRDFTINSLLIDENKNILDLLNLGFNDLEKKEINCINDCDKRFQEDALRIIRALYFSVKLDFKISDETSLSIKNNNFLIKKLKKERITNEFIKIFNIKNKLDTFLNLLKVYGLDKVLNIEKVVNYLYINKIKNIDIDQFLFLSYFFEQKPNIFFNYTRKIKYNIDKLTKYIHLKAFSLESNVLFFENDVQSMLYINSIRKILNLNYFKTHEINKKYENIQKIFDYLKDINFDLKKYVQNIDKNEIKNFKLKLLSNLLYDFENNQKLNISKYL